MTTADPLLTDLLQQEIAARREKLARLELSALDRRIAVLESTPVATTKEPPRRRWYLRKHWLLSFIFLALLLLGGLTQRATVGSLIDNVLAHDPHVQVGDQRLDAHTLATAAVAVKGRILATIVPTAPELPQATPQPTIGTGATVPQEEAPTPVAAQQPAAPEPPQDVQPGNMSVQPAPPAEQSAPAEPAPAPPAQPTAAPTAETEGQVVAASQDAPVGANGEPAINYELEAQKFQAAATAKAFANGWQGVKP